MSYPVSRAQRPAALIAAALLGLSSCGDDDAPPTSRAHSGVVADLMLEASESTTRTRAERREVASFRVTIKNRSETPWIMEGPEDFVQTMVMPPGGADDRSKMLPAVALRKVGPKSFSFPHAFGAGDVTTILVAASCYEGKAERARVVTYDASGDAAEASRWQPVRGRKDPYFLEFDLMETTSPGAERAGVRLEFEGTGSHAALMSMTLAKESLASRLPPVGSPVSTQRGEQWCSAAGLSEGAPWSVPLELEGGKDGRRRLELAATLPAFVRTLPRGTRLEVELRTGGGEPVAARSFELRGLKSDAWRDVQVDFEDVPAGAYELSVAVADDDERRVSSVLVGDALFLEPTDNPKTVLLITSDTHRSDYLGLSQPMAFVDTPSLDALGQRGLFFERAYSTTNITNPSHIAVMSGIHPRDTQIVDNKTQLTSRVTTLAEAFRANGYRTVAAISTQHLDPGQSGLGQGFGRLNAPAEFKRSGNVAVDEVREWLEDSVGVSTFAWVHVFDAHAPYDPPSKLLARTAKGVDRSSDDWDLDERFRPKWVRDRGITNPDYVTALYAAEVDYVDRALDELLGLPRIQDGWVAFTADHGESFTTHSIYWDHAGMYLPMLTVPLILAGPGVEARRDGTPVQQIHVGRTLLDLAGVDAEFPGRSLLEMSGRTEPLFGLSSHGLQATVTLDDWHLVLDLREYSNTGNQHLWQKGRTQLFSRADGINTEVDVASDNEELVAQLREALIAWLASASSEALGAEVELDASAAENLDALGYTGFTSRTTSTWYTEEK